MVHRRLIAALLGLLMTALAASEVRAAAPRLVSAVSRKTHDLQSFDIKLPLSGASGIECRDVTHKLTLVLTFDRPVRAGQVSVDTGKATVSGSPKFRTNTMTVNLTDVANAQELKLKLSKVQADNQSKLGSASVSIRILRGDVDASGDVSAADLKLAMSFVNKALNSSRFRGDVNASGKVTASDVITIKALEGTNVNKPPVPVPHDGTSPASTLYVATMTPEVNAKTLGSGYSTLQLSADETTAIVRVTYSNLTSPLTGFHIHGPADPGQNGGILFDFDTALVQNDAYTWIITDTPSTTKADIIAAIKAGRTYINLHTAQYPAGEIRGHYLLTTGSTTFVPPAPPPPLPGGTPTPQEAVRFLTEASYGATSESIYDVQANGYDNWITKQISTPPSLITPILQNRRLQQTPEQIVVTDFWNAWWQNSLTGPDQLRQRVAFALSQVFVISQDNANLEQQPFALATYYDMLANDAFGNFRNLLEHVTLSPAMGVYLDLRGSRKADGLINPNENYPREILQLFSIGLNQLHPDGTLKLGPDGLPIPTYDQDVIVGMARALTGWNYHQLGTAVNPPPNFDLPMTLIPSLHETGVMPGQTYSKLLLDGVTLPPGHSGEQDLKDTHDLIFNHPNVGPFICRQLIQRLVCSNPSPGYIYRVVSKFNDNGAGVRGDMGAVVRAILTDYEARSPDVLNNQGYGHLKEPVVRAAQLIRAFRPTSVSGYWKIGNTDASLGQTPLRAQTVFNFYIPGYIKPGELAQAGLVAPEFQITSETTSITSSNFMQFGVENGFGSGTDIQLDFTQERQMAGDPNALLDRLNLILMGGQLNPQTKSIIKNHLLTIGASDTLGRARAAVHLIGTSPEYCVQR